MGEVAHRKASCAKGKPGVEHWSEGEGLFGRERREVWECCGEEGQQSADGPGERWVKDEAGLAGAKSGRESPPRMESAMGPLAGGLLPAEQMKAEIVTAGWAIEDEGKDGKQSDEGDEDQGQPIALLHEKKAISRVVGELMVRAEGGPGMEWLRGSDGTKRQVGQSGQMDGDGVSRLHETARKHDRP